MFKIKGEKVMLRALSNSVKSLLPPSEKDVLYNEFIIYLSNCEYDKAQNFINKKNFDIHHKYDGSINIFHVLVNDASFYTNSGSDLGSSSLVKLGLNLLLKDGSLELLFKKDNAHQAPMFCDPIHRLFDFHEHGDVSSEKGILFNAACNLIFYKDKKKLGKKIEKSDLRVYQYINDNYCKNPKKMISLAFEQKMPTLIKFLDKLYLTQEGNPELKQQFLEVQNEFISKLDDQDLNHLREKEELILSEVKTLRKPSADKIKELQEVQTSIAILTPLKARYAKRADPNYEHEDILNKNLFLREEKQEEPEAMGESDLESVAENIQ
ncbi:MAG: hypothetical protein DGJ47_000255 [Rickettsiaceae bacterium]